MRIFSIDFCRLLAIVAVICIHTHPFMSVLFPDSAYRLPEYILTQSSRFAVPFFFIAAGFFLGRKALADPELRIRPTAYLRRLFMLLVAWSILYVLVPADWPALFAEGYLPLVSRRIASLLDSPFVLLFEGARVHLWFLPALMIAVCLLALLTPGGRVGPLLAVASLLFAIGLLAGSYSVTPLGIPLPFTTRDGPFLSTICLAIGYLLARRRTAVSPAAAFSIMTGGLLLHIFESWTLYRFWGVSMLSHEYLFGTVVCAAGLLLFALAVPNLGRRWDMHLPGQYTLGVYLSHLMALDLVGPFRLYCELHIWQFLFPLLVFLLSAGLTHLLARSRLQFLVT